MEVIMKEEQDMDGVDCYIKKGILVRCRDCYYSSREWSGLWCLRMRIHTDDHGYCSDGKRRGERDETNDPVDLVRDLADRIGIHQLYAIAVDLRGEPEPKRGKWTQITNGRIGLECSCCHNYAPSYQNGVEYPSTFCPHCGAKMEQP